MKTTINEERRLVLAPPEARKRLEMSVLSGRQEIRRVKREMMRRLQEAETSLAIRENGLDVFDKAEQPVLVTTGSVVRDEDGDFIGRSWDCPVCGRANILPRGIVGRCQGEDCGRTVYLDIWGEFVDL